MAEIRLGLDPSGVRTGIEEIARSFRTLIDASRQAQQAISQISAPVIKLKVEADLGGIARVESALAAIKAPSVKLAVDTTQAITAIEQVDRQIAASKAPTLKLDVDASKALAEIEKVGQAIKAVSEIHPAPVSAHTDVREIAQATQETEKQAQAVNGLAQAQANQAGQTNLLAQANAALAQTTLQAAAAADRHLQAGTKEAALAETIARGLNSQDAATRKAAQAQATLLSTFGGSDRALSQFAVAISRVQKSLEGGTISIQQAAQQIAIARERFTTANINAKDLRLNMQGLNQSFNVLSSVVGRFNPVLGATISSMLHAGQAAGKLSGGFILLGPIVAILTTIAAGFTAVAVAGDRTGSIPGHLARIKAGLSELVAQLATRIGATGTIGWFLTKIEEWAPTSGDKLQDLRNRVAELRAEQEKLQASGRPIVGPNLNVGKELAASQRDLFILEERERQKLILGIDKEAAAQEELRKKINDLIAAKIAHTITDKEYLQLLGQLNKQEKQRVESLKENRDALKDAKEEARKAAEITKAYADAIAGLRAEEEQATVNEQHRLEDLKVSNDLLEKEIVATEQGTAALKAFNIEKARTLELERQRNSKANLSAADSAALVSEAERGERLRQQLADQAQLAKETDKIWDNTITNIQEAWGKLFANILSGGNKTFKDLTSSIKGLFTSLLGNLITGAFAPFFNDLKRGIGGGGVDSGGGGGGIGGLLRSGSTDILQAQPDGSWLLIQRNPIGSQAAPNIAGATFGIGDFFSGITSSISSGFDKVLSIFTGSTASKQAFTQRNAGPTSLAPATGFQAPGSFNLSSGFSSIAAGIGGIIAGIQLNNALTTSTQYKLERTLGKIGELLGGLVGGVLGAVFGFGVGAGVGSLVGSVAGGAILSGFGGIIGAKSAGKSINETSSFKESFDRNIAISGDPITALVMALLLRNKPDIGLQLRTLARASDFPAVNLTPSPGERPTGTLVKGTTAVEGPFGFIGAIGSGTGGDLIASQVQSFVRSLALFDAAVANHLTRAEEAIVKGSGLLTDKTFSNTRNSEKIFKTRAEAVLQALGVPLQTGRDLFDVPNAQGKKQTNADIVQNLNEFLVARRQIQDLITDLRGLTPPTNNAAKALDDIHQKMNQIRIAAPDLGIALEDFAHLEEEAVAKFKSAFAGSIDDAISAFVDPFSLAVRELDVAQAQRLREAITAESDLTKVARLNALERAKLLEQANAPLQQLIDQIQITPAGSSPLTALGTSESRFFSLAGTPGADRSDIAAAAQSFLALGEQFLGGPTFSGKRDLVLSTLESLLLTLPGVSADTGEQLDGLNLETARGNAANEQLLSNLITETSAMRNEIVLLNTKLERALAK